MFTEERRYGFCGNVTISSLPLSMYFAGQQGAQTAITSVDGLDSSDAFNPQNAHPGSILMGFRWYNPTSGHFTTRDPQGYAGGINLYAYCRNNPIGHLDPMGTSQTVSTVSAVAHQTYKYIATESGKELAQSMVATQVAKSSATLASRGVLMTTGTIVSKIAGPIGAALFVHSFYQEARKYGDEWLSFLKDSPEEELADQPSSIFQKMHNCFVAGTLVAMADGTYKPIEQITQGDRVLSRDPLTGQTASKQVAQTFVNDAPQTLLLRFDNGEQIETTPGHPFCVEGRGFVLAGQLALGNAIVTRAGPATKLTRIENKAQTARVYNFEVEGFHTYFVGSHDGGLWVHNLSYGQARDCLRSGAGSVHVESEKDAIRLLYEVFIQERSNTVWHNSEMWLPGAAKDYYTRADEGYYHLDNQLGTVGKTPGRLLHHGLTDADSQYRHLRVHLPGGRKVYINYGARIW